MIEGWGFNPPPNWPKPPGSWMPPAGWLPDPGWGPVPPGWQLWIPDRQVQRKRGRPVIGLVAVLAAVALAVLVPRADGPGADDPLAGGVAILSPQLPALIPTAAPVTPAATAITKVPATVKASATAKPAAAATSPNAATVTAAASITTPAAVIQAFLNCARLNRVYPNGVGMPTAVDRTTGTPVTAFGRSAAIYRANLKHDQDGDGIACEPS